MIYKIYADVYDDMPNRGGTYVRVSPSHEKMTFLLACLNSQASVFLDGSMHTAWQPSLAKNYWPFSRTEWINRSRFFAIQSHYESQSTKSMRQQTEKMEMENEKGRNFLFQFWCHVKRCAIFLSFRTGKSLFFTPHDNSFKSELQINLNIGGIIRCRTRIEFTTFLTRRPLSRLGRPTGIWKTSSVLSAPGAGVY